MANSNLPHPQSAIGKGVGAVARRGGVVVLWLLILLPPLILWRSAPMEAFREPKLWTTEVLALLALLALGWRWREAGLRMGSALLRHPAVLAVAPVLVVASVTWWTSEHRDHVGAALPSLWIGGGSLIAWSLLLEEREVRRLLRGLMLPATALAVVGILQYHKLYEPIPFRGGDIGRLGVTSFAGGPFDLSAYLLLPALLVQVELASSRSTARRALWAALLGLFLYGMATTRTLAPLAGLVIASTIFWAGVLPRRRVAIAGAVAASLAVGAVVSVPGLQSRVQGKLSELDEPNRLLTGRLDAWRAALWMVGRHPWLGVGHGAYRAEFGEARLALAEEGVEFFRGHRSPFFVNAHSDPLEALAEWGCVGALVLAAALAILIRQSKQRFGRLRRSGAEREAALVVAGLVGLGLVASVDFPFHLALVGYPGLLFCAWVLREER